MMRKVVDSNFLQSEELRAFLSDSVENKTVLADYAAMEAYKGDTLVAIFQRMEILAAFPTQVIVLKGTQAICGLQPRDGSMLQDQLIDEDQTSGFPEYCRHLDAAKRGDRSIQAQLLDNGREATAHMARMLADAPIFVRGIDDIAATYTAAELKALRTGAPYTESMGEHFSARQFHRRSS
jgi:hypothetical protein